MQAHCLCLLLLYVFSKICIFGVISFPKRVLLIMTSNLFNIIKNTFYNPQGPIQMSTHLSFAEMVST